LFGGDGEDLRGRVVAVAGGGGHVAAAGDHCEPAALVVILPGNYEVAGRVHAHGREALVGQRRAAAVGRIDLHLARDIIAGRIEAAGVDADVRPLQAQAVAGNGRVFPADHEAAGRVDADRGLVVIADGVEVHREL